MACWVQIGAIPWGWSTSNTVDISNWTVQQSGSPNLLYVYSATGGSPNTYNTVTTYYLWAYPNGVNSGLATGTSALNSLQQGNQVSQSETDWVTTNGPLAATDQTVDSSFEFGQGEVFGYQPCDHMVFTNCSQFNFSNSPSATYDQPIVIDFSNPTLQLPATAPWTLTFTPWPQTVPTNATITGTVQVTNGPASSPVTINLTYVVQPQNTVTTLPSNQACPGNQYQFNASSNVVNNGSPPLSVTIPAGQTSVSFPLSFQTFNGNNYNVQVIAWLPSTALGGSTVVNPQAAWCLTVPNTTIGTSTLQHR